MLKTELRIGNLVGATIAGNQIPHLRGINEIIYPKHGFVLYTIENGADIDKAKWFFPVPLDEEVLTCCGVKKSGRSDRYFLNYHGFCLSFDGDDWCLHTDPDINVIITYCRYLHQLQNLYFVLTRKELEFDPTIINPT